MRKLAFFAFAGLLACICNAEPVCIDGVCYPDEESARAAGALADGGLADLKNILDSTGDKETSSTNVPEVASSKVSEGHGTGNVRLALGYMEPDEFKGFLSGKASAADSLEKNSVAVVFLLVLLGGLLMNLTPCVLPLVPVSLAIVGRGAARGAAYGLGMALSYGALGLAAAFGGMAFGAIQSSPWFNLVVAVVFLILGLATSEVFFIDFSRFRPRPKVGVSAGEKGGLLAPFLLGCGTAVLAGACVAPILIATLLLTAKWFAAGRVWAVALPFVLGTGMGLPWPFITAGLSVLPKPGAWMKWVNRLFAVLLFGMAVWYGWQAWAGFTLEDGSSSERAEVSEETTEGDATRPRLVILGAPWCKNCTAMEKTTLKEPSVVEAMKRFSVSHIEINTFEDLKKYPELAGLDIKGVPAYVIIENKLEKEKE